MARTELHGWPMVVTAAAEKMHRAALTAKRRGRSQYCLRSMVPRLAQAEKKIKKLEAQRAELRQAMVDTLDALEMPPSKSLFNDGMYQANATLLRKLDAQNGE